MDAGQVTAWVAGYESAWRSPGTEALSRLFAADASYSQAPYDEPVRGLAAITTMWEAEREGPDEVFAMTSGVVAVDGDTAVVRVEVWYGQPVQQQFRDLWVVRFGDDGRCTAFEEWPFWPSQQAAPPPPPADRAAD
jgi:hypothetical protein